MWIVAIAWIYVVVLMAATEPTVVGGIMTFLFYCALPLSLLFYISGARRRRHRQRIAGKRQHDNKRGEIIEETGDVAGGDGD
jgi:membrane protein implicated in regulation of membrane protease activity